MKRFIIRALLFIGFLGGVLLSMFSQFQAVDNGDAFIKSNDYASWAITQAERAVLHHANNVALPILLLSLVCLVVLAVSIKKDNN